MKKLALLLGIALLLAACKLPVASKLDNPHDPLAPNSNAGAYVPAGLAGAPGDSSAILTWSPVAKASSYNLYWSRSAASASKAGGTAINSVSSPYSHTGLSNGSTYYYAISAVVDGIESTSSSPVSVTPTLQAAAPSAPDGLALSTGDGSATISWNVVTGATSYNLYWSTSPGLTTATGTKIADATSPYNQTGLTNGTAYYWIVTAVKDAHESAACAPGGATPQVSAIGAPTNLSASPGNGQATISWNAVTGATSYNLYWSTDPGLTAANGTKVAGATSPYAQSSLENGTTYYWIATAITAGTESGASNQASATPAGFKVTYDGNGATGGTTPKDNVSYLPNAAVTPATNSFIRIGYDFEAWNTLSDGTGTSYASGAGSFAINSNTVLYAIWNKKATGTIVNPTAPSAAYILTLYGSTSLNFGVQANFTSAYTGNASSYQWYLNGVAISGATASALTITPSYSTFKYGANTLMLSIKDANGAGYSKALTLSVDNALANYVSPNVGVMVGVEGGTFQRDSAATNLSTVSSFHMSQNLITRTQFLAVMGADPSNVTYSSGTSDPVQNVNWYMAVAFCNKLSLLEGMTPVYSVSTVTDWSALTFASIPTATDANWNNATATWTNSGYRLPTEMEYMWAAMGGTSDTRSGDIVGGVNTGGYTKGYAGSQEAGKGRSDIGSFAWTVENSSSKTHPVGTKTGNELGLNDMSGNGWEWCWDWYSDNGTYPNYAISGPVTDYRGAASGTSATPRVQRGGSWGSLASSAAVDYRGYGGPDNQSYHYDFRVVAP